MTDPEFLDYCYWHSQTDRHLFHVDHAKRLLKLAGEDENRPDIPRGANAFVGMDFEFVKPRVETARGWVAWLEKNPRLREVFS